MSDNLTVFGTDYTGVTGIKAKQTGGSNLTFIRPTGTKSISANGTGIDVAEYASVDVSVSGGGSPNLQSKTATPTTSSQTITPDAGYDGLSSVTVNAMNLDVGTFTENGTYYPQVEIDADGFSQVTVDVPVPFCVPVYFDDREEMFLPDCAWAEVQSAYADAERDLCFMSYDSDVTVNGAYVEQNNQLSHLFYIVSGPGYDDTHGVDTTHYITYTFDGNGAVEVSHTVTIAPDGSQTITTNGTHNVYYDSSVTVSVPTGTARTSSDLTVSGATVTAPAGLYSNAASASVASGTAGTPTATKGAVSNHAVSVTPSVTNVTGYITGGTKTGTAVSVSASELVSGSQTITTNDTYDVTNLASVVVDVQGGSTPDVQVATATAYTGANLYVGFTDLAGEPTSFVLMCTDSIATSSTPTVAAVVYDGNDVIGQTITNIANAQVSYNDSVFSVYYDEGDLSIIISDQSSVVFDYYASYELVYTYNGTVGNIQTDDVQVGSGATSITFTGLDDEPEYFSCLFKSNFSTSSGYQRVIGVVYDGTDVYGLEMDSSAKYSDAHWTYSYSNGSLTISSSGTNAGGYFHQPGYYQLTYAIGGDQTLQTKTVTPTTSTQNVTADTAQGYTALKKVVVEPIPSQYIVPTGNIAITSNTATGQSLDVSQYATATVAVPTGGGSASIDTKTVTASNYPVSISFTSMKGEPKAFMLRSTSQISSSGNTTYYYIIDMLYDGNSNKYCNGNCFRIGSTRRVDPITTASSGGTVTGYTWSYSGTTLTITTSAASRSASPGAFNNNYQLVYIY